MLKPVASLSGSSDTPAVAIYANPVHALYHYLVRQGTLPEKERDMRFATAAAQAWEARHLLGPHGIWEEWEVPLAAGETAGEATAGLRSTMEGTVHALGSALTEAQGEFESSVWPGQQALIQEAVGMLSRSLAPHFDAMARRQAQLLDLTWPEHINAYLVPAGYAWQGAYSHPLTIDIGANRGLTLCETLVHEATHVADLHTARSGGETLGKRVTARLEGEGISRNEAWGVWHAIIFAASGQQVRHFIDAGYVDFATQHDLYSWFKVPDGRDLWDRHTSGDLNEEMLLDELARRVRVYDERRRRSPSGVD